MGIPLYVTYCFFFAAFNIFSLHLTFDSLINVCLGVFLLVFTLYGNLCFLDLGGYFLFMLGKFSTITPSNIFSDPCFFSFSGTPYNSNVGAFNVISDVSETVLNSFFFKLE